MPKQRRTFCKGKNCKKHTLHKVTQYKKGRESSSAQGAYAAFTGGGTCARCVCSILNCWNVRKVCIQRFQWMERAHCAYAAFSWVGRAQGVYEAFTRDGT